MASASPKLGREDCPPQSNCRRSLACARRGAQGSLPTLAWPNHNICLLAYATRCRTHRNTRTHAPRTTYKRKGRGGRTPCHFAPVCHIMHVSCVNMCSSGACARHAVWPPSANTCTEENWHAWQQSLLSRRGNRLLRSTQSAMVMMEHIRREHRKVGEAHGVPLGRGR